MIFAEEPNDALKFGQNDPRLVLILSFSICVTDLAHLVGLKEENLAESFVGVDLGRERGSI